jgi:hypothetical protein
MLSQTAALHTRSLNLQAESPAVTVAVAAVTYVVTDVCSAAQRAGAVLPSHKRHRTAATSNA